MQNKENEKMLIKKTTKIAILVAVIVVILLGTVLGVNYKRNLDVKNDIKAANSLITAYNKKFDKESEIDKKEKIYNDFKSDKELNDYLKKYSKNHKELKDNYDKELKSEYSWFIDYYTDKINDINNRFSETKDINSCKNYLDEFTNISNEISSNKTLEKDDINSLNDKINSSNDVINEEIKNVVNNYNNKFTEASSLDINNSSKDDLNNAITNLNSLKDEISKLPEEYFKDLIGQIDSKITEISNKLDEIKKKEEAAAAAAKKAEEEAAKKAQESSGNKTSKKSSKSNKSVNNSSNSSNSNESNVGNNSSNNNSNSSSIKRDPVLPLKIHGVLFYPPQKVISIYNSRTNTVWNSGSTTYNGVDACEWAVDDDYYCIADQNGNILVEY